MRFISKSDWKEYLVRYGRTLNRIFRYLRTLLGLILLFSFVVGIDDIRRESNKKSANRKEETMHQPFGLYEKYLKRPLDFSLSFLALILLSPMLLFIGILVRMKLGSPVLFSQERPGRDEKIFKLYKFRSMTNEKDKDGKLLPDEKRLTKFGRALRSSSLDELPELFNILKGDMSIIGPRPLAAVYLPYYTEAERHRHDVRPGLTGLAQISGRNNLSWDEKFKYDLLYIKKITFVEDFRIILLTVKKVLRREGIGQGGDAPTSLFTVRQHWELTKNGAINPSINSENREALYERKDYCDRW